MNGVAQRSRAADAGLRWTGAELEAARSHLLELDQARIEALESELADTDDSGETSPLVGEHAAEILDRLQGGPGFAVVVGSGLARLSDEQLRSLLYAVSLALGHPMAQNPAGDRVVSVRDEAPSDPSARGYRTSERLPMHTDAADVTGLMCLSQGRAGGRNVFASSATVHDTLTDECPELIHEYYRSWHWDLRGLEPDGAPPTLRGSIFSYYAGRLSCRYAPGILRSGAGRVGERLTDSQTKALDRFDEVAGRPSLQVSHRLTRGECVWMNNYAVLHGREAFDDGEDAGSVRHLLRTWVWLRDGPELARHFASPREVY
jgi:hypothetical protein